MKNTTSNLQIKLPNWVTSAVKVVVFGVLLYCIAEMFKTRVSFTELAAIFLNLSWFQVVVCMAVTLLMPVNWACEARKWQILVKKFQALNFPSAFNGVLLGATLGNISPLMLGDYVGRLRRFPNQTKLRGSAALLLGHGMQAFVLLCFGKFGYIVFLRTVDSPEAWLHKIISYVLTLLIVAGIMYFFKLVRPLSRVSIPVVSTVNNYSNSAIWALLFWGVSRQLIFTIQFVLLLRVFAVNLPLPTLVGLVSLVFVAKTIGAVLGFFGDFFGRQVSATYFFGFYAVSLDAVFVATLFLWLINLFIPMLIGSFLVFTKPTANPI